MIVSKWNSLGFLLTWHTEYVVVTRHKISILHNISGVDLWCYVLLKVNTIGLVNFHDLQLHVSSTNMILHVCLGNEWMLTNSALVRLFHRVNSLMNAQVWQMSKYFVAWLQIFALFCNRHKVQTLVLVFPIIITSILVKF